MEVQLHVLSVLAGEFLVKNDFNGPRSFNKNLVCHNKNNDGCLRQAVLVCHSPDIQRRKLKVLEGKSLEQAMLHIQILFTDCSSHTLMSRLQAHKAHRT